MKDLKARDRWFLTDTDSRMGPGRWWKCPKCRWRFRAIGRFVPKRTPSCPVCEQRRKAKEGKAA